MTNRPVIATTAQRKSNVVPRIPRITINADFRGQKFVNHLTNVSS